MPVNDGGTDHNAPIGGDQDSQNQGDIKAHFLRDAFEKAQRGTKNEMHQKRNPRRKAERSDEARIARDVSGDIFVIPRADAEHLFKEKPAAHFPEKNQDVNAYVIDQKAQGVTPFAGLGKNALFENAHFRRRTEDEKKHKNPESIRG